MLVELTEAEWEDVSYALYVYADLAGADSVNRLEALLDAAIQAAKDLENGGKQPSTTTRQPP